MSDATPILAIDSSAFVRRYLTDRDRPLVVETMADATHWCASALARTEVLALLHRAALDSFSQQALWHRFRDDWDAVAVVPVDDRCLQRAAEIAALYRVRTVDAIHLAAADRLPRPARLLTFARQQIPAATALGLEVVSPRSGADW
ncbi:MAG: type II toxin-antitoxin system VapC family toxin [Acidimicrobiales bacterium]|nr:type II toxin-antitoxin system VapC family toxin [Acidimicrobiales bacterium]